MTALHWVRNDKTPAWILRPVAKVEGGYFDLLTRFTWTQAQPISEGHPDAAVDAQLAEAYRAPSKICAIGDVKEIGGRMYTKRLGSCDQCDFRKKYGCKNPGNFINKSIEEGGCECEGTIWKRCRK